MVRKSTLVEYLRKGLPDNLVNSHTPAATMTPIMSTKGPKLRFARIVGTVSIKHHRLRFLESLLECFRSYPCPGVWCATECAPSSSLPNGSSFVLLTTWSDWGLGSKFRSSDFIGSSFELWRSNAYVLWSAPRPGLCPNMGLRAIL